MKDFVKALVNRVQCVCETFGNCHGSANSDPGRVKIRDRWFAAGGIGMRVSPAHPLSGAGLCFQSVADSVDGLDPARILRIRLELGTQAGDVIVHGARGWESRETPDHIQKTIA